MVLFMLCVKAELENVASLKLLKDHNICLSVRNPLSDYEVREKVVVNPTSFVEQEDGAREPPHHLALRWDGNKKPSTMTILSDSEVKAALKKDGKKAKGKSHGHDNLIPRDYSADDSGNFVPLLCVECRGLEPTHFYPLGNEFVVISSGGTEFHTDVDLSESDWADYDSDSDLSVSLSNIEFIWKTM